MATNSEKEGFEIGVQLILVLAILLHIAHHFWWDNYLFDNLLIKVPFLKKGIFSFIRTLNSSLGIFINPFLNKMVIVFLMSLHGIGSKGIISNTIKLEYIYKIGTIGLLGYLLSAICIYFPISNVIFYYCIHFSYILSSTFFLLYINKASQYASRYYSFNGQDIFNDENETFPQNEELKGFENEYSIHFQTKYYYKNKWRDGWVNVVNPFRSTMVLGTPGSGKSFSILEPAIRQSIWKGYATYIYDFKYPTLTKVGYNAYLKSIEQNAEIWRNKKGKLVLPKFYVINFDDVEYSHRCNPLRKEFLLEVLDANESAQTIMLNINKSWVKEQGSFFPESAINYVSIVIWYLRTAAIKYEKLYNELLISDPTSPKLDLYYRFSNVCTFPHVVELTSYKNTNASLMVFSKYRDIEILTRPFQMAIENDAGQQIAGQLASAQIGIAKLSSPSVYWVMTGDDFTLDINNPDEPKILAMGNDPKRIAIYGTLFSLFTSRLIKIVNQQGKRHSALFWDELPTIFIKGLDLLIATARSNKVATWLGIQDFTQLKRDYGTEEADVIKGIQGNLFSGQVVFDTANTLSERFGKTNQEKESVTLSQSDTSVQISQELNNVIPASKISELKQGNFVGVIAGSFGEEADLKKFNAKVLPDLENSKDSHDLKKIKDFNEIAKKLGVKIESEEELKKFKIETVYNNFLSIKEDITLLIDYEKMLLLSQEELDIVDKKPTKV